jgi:hypothetical protein
MRREQIQRFCAVFALALVAGHRIAAAQAQGTAPPPPDASVGLARQVNLSPKEQLAESDSYLTKMDSARLLVRRMLEEARNQRDVVKTLCLNDKLNQMDVAIRSARERRQNLELAANRGDADLSNHEFTILTVLRQRTEQLSAEANQCIGKEAIYLGENAIKSEIDPTLPDDPSDFPPDIVYIPVPSCTTCVK